MLLASAELNQKMEKYEIVKRIGLGAHGAVYLVKNKVSQKLFAMKKIEIDERKKSRTKEAVLKEASILSQLRHPHIILFHQSFIDPSEDYVCMILDYCDGGNLSERIQDAAQKLLKFSEKQIMQWFIQIVMAVQYIHSKHILHRDLKTENVFLNKRNVVKVGDFGISRILDNTIDVAKTVVGTPSYLSPELCQDIPYNSKSDIWAVGCLLYEMTTLHTPFDGQSLIGLFVNIIKAGYKPFPADTPIGIQDLVSKILQKTPEHRPSASAILTLPYVKNHLASFISDTENIRDIRIKRDNSCDSPDSDSLTPLPSSSYMEQQSATKSLFSPRQYHTADPILQSYKTNINSPVPDQHSPDLCNHGIVSKKPEDQDDGGDYSDDFDDSSSDLGDLSKCGGNEDEEAVYADDFEDSDSGEDLDLVVAQAKKAQTIHPDDEFFVEDDDMAMSQTLTQIPKFRSIMEAARSQVTHL
ncbi:serine/threonine-protein kinase Nek6 [Biomphalaria glabrata]|nr:serine/threonine-protein kinase Nek6-like [Biomphalaria glabrata]